jgi:hypothetical protein
VKIVDTIVILIADIPKTAIANCTTKVSMEMIPLAVVVLVADICLTLMIADFKNTIAQCQETTHLYQDRRAVGCPRYTDKCF